MAKEYIDKKSFKKDKKQTLKDCKIRNCGGKGEIRTATTDKGAYLGEEMICLKCKNTHILANKKMVNQPTARRLTREALEEKWNGFKDNTPQPDPVAVKKVETQSSTPDPYEYKAKFIKNHDGDTVTLDIDLGGLGQYLGSLCHHRGF